MNNIYLSQIKNFVGEQIELKGWIYNFRSSGSIIFLQFRDGTGVIQGVIIKKEVSEETFLKAKGVGLETSVILTGKVKAEPRSSSGYELLVTKIEIIQIPKEDYPISKKEHGPDFLLDNRHLWLRSQRQWAIQKIRDQLIHGIYDFYRTEGFTKIDTPIFTPNACEGTTTLFEVPYFEEKAYLSQSGQLYLEAAIASFAKVYDFSPVFRAEKSKTRRHLTEFWMNNSEMAFYDWQDNIHLQEKLVQYLLDQVLANCQEELKIVGRNLEPLKKIKPPYIQMTYSEAVKELHGLGSDIKEGEDFGNDDETILTKTHEKPIFVTHYPKEIKAFYMKESDDPKYVLCNDLLVPEGYGEMIGGSQREDNYDKLLQRVKDHKLNIEDFSWYLDLRKYGSVPHSGFGLGLERMIAWVCGLPHVRETIPFPRTIYRLKP
ncbi:asparagine--tRNA ligase [candidate division CPR3 bacterium GWF2_35_18]|uniref:Asparagine--tRNA ligase n=1 Tax=candidate division CPR3 bacterium GW2011_GWF2_35_18 TaxID=1618350 RepID=A0A0G0C2E6_UNCC3|nr:MAG: Asparagine-tRNA ligase [candidate division CPR3 bacterium GW2011_GWF2_35_18]OGB63437.1 MAG: asparagine--tRNA ligase [candidate division CPR3 bacterium GWF2_35_18]OGB64818.1 MAG: asparagine--tRNA ligase [candidate division CPR3 bacterium RIFOXYA2_FULL_35_13]OGB76936.1 MAG: asparagine--tRNA ligase [candidate division CPR3 bacterium RIFOXYC2_FULL_35_7]